jgi:hypothetical protein
MSRKSGQRFSEEGHAPTQKNYSIKQKARPVTGAGAIVKR